ncbi:Carboxypeptidase regulatory-like domain-containing protein [Granulicella pectinivorans]|uniref:Carboxypeptidase regulatory-like domain-containing protein n=1 Tax=Granulicella pectinivorans TaxID=474950 RepID=A0A1I6MZK1_9BACT|nr:carboxypeptidase-like regulatory domain-containing protein [Granulicella pectinivorans]SFS21104.1 Carboxypeptidase regulatory-like domain-containing protein [Granulicella pectinivorans]
MQTMNCQSVRFALPQWAVLLVLAVAAALFSCSAGAQSSSSAVNGVVSDPNQAVVAGAKVTLKNTETNVERDTVSNGSGNYFFTNVPPARYTVSFVMQGFQTQRIAAFDLGVAQAITINASLKVGAVSESVTVEATGAQVESSTAQLGTTIGQRQVNELPLNGRNFTQLLTLTPGVSSVSTGQNSSASNTSNVAGSTVTFPSINGAGNRSTIFLVDGMNDNSAWYNTYAVPPIIDTIEEFKINSHNDSQYGGSLGGVVNMTSKAGTNTYHGSAWEYIRNNSFDAQSYFPSVLKPSYHFNTYGGQAGGAVRIPHLYDGRDKTFFEFGAEITHYAKSGATNILEPTAAQLGESTYGGPQTQPALDFSSSACPVGSYSTATCQLYDPTAGGNGYAAGSNGYGPYRPAYLGNQIPVSQLNKYSIAYINAIFTQAPIAIPGVAATVANQQITAATRQRTYNYTGRIDQHIGNKDFIFFRYGGFQSYNLAPAGLPTLFTTTELPSQQCGVNWTHIFNASTTMQVQYAKSHVENYVITAFNNPNIWQVFGCSADMCNSYVQKATLMSTISITGGVSGGENNSPTTNLSSIHEWSGSVTKTVGSHQIQAGGGWDQVNYTAVLQNASIGFTGGSTSNFNNNTQNPTPTLASPGCPQGVQCSTVNSVGATSTATKQAGSGLADFLLDYPNNENKRNVNLTERPGGIASIYLQDSWKIVQKLTFNYGLRYDRSVIPAFGTQGTVGLNGSIETGDFDFNTGDYIVQQLPPLCSVRGHAPCLPSATLPAHVRVASGGKILHGTKTNFGPRLGLAYRVNDTMSIRAGFGMTYDNWASIIQMTQNYQGSWPDTGTLQINNTNTPGTIYTSAQNPFAANGGNLPSTTPFSSSNVNYMVDPQWKNPYSEQYNLGIEQQFGRNTVLSLNYVGSESHRLDIGGYYNTGTPAAGSSFATRQTLGTTGQPFPYTVPEKSWDHSGANATYNALQASLARHFTSGLGFMVAYTWSKTLNEGGDGFFGVEGGVPEDPYNVKTSRGPAGFNLPHILTANVVYELPFGTGKMVSTGNRTADYVIGHWQVNSIFVAQSGRNFNVLSAGDIANTGNASTYERANLVGNPYQAGPISGNPTCVPPAGNTRTIQQWFNPCAFATPASGTLGNSPRNFLQAANYFNVDASIFRIFPIKERLQAKLDVEAFNVLNHPILGTPGSTTTTTTTYGIITGTNNTSRVLQGAVRIQF